MKKVVAALIVFLALQPFSAQAQIRESPSVGGGGGTAFNDVSANPNNLPVTGITIVTNLNPADHSQVIIGALQVQWGDAQGPIHGGKAPLAQPSKLIQFKPGEAIKKVSINAMPYNFPANPPPTWVAGLRIVTSKSSYTLGNMSFGPTTECAVRDGETFVGFYGRAGSYIDRLGCVISGQTTPTVAKQEREPQQVDAGIKPNIENPSRQWKRAALVIGNSDYQFAPRLPNPSNDAKALANSFRAAGFQTVVTKENLGRDEIVAALQSFAAIADGSDWAVVYYSGHGIAMNGVNYLIPVDAHFLVDRDVDLEAIDVNKVLRSIQGALKIQVVILDACRVNPFLSQMRRTSATRSIARGFERVEPEANTLVVFSAKDGETALDGNGSNSPFATALIKRIATPNLEIRRLFDLVRDDVVLATGKQQQPFTYGSLSGSEDFFFVSK